MATQGAGILIVAALHLLICFWVSNVEASCMPRQGCRQALAHYSVSSDDSLDAIYNWFSTDLEHLSQYNKISNTSFIPKELLIPFPCECQSGILGHYFAYEVVGDDITLFSIADEKFEGLSRPDWIVKATPLADEGSIFAGLKLKVPVNCSCGNPDLSPEYGLFATYVVQANDTLELVSQKFNISAHTVQRYNPGMNFQSLAPQSILFVPATDVNGTMPRYDSGNEKHGGVDTSVIVGASVGGAVAILGTLGAGIFWFLRKRRQPGVVKDDQQTPMPSPLMSSAMSAPKAGTSTASGGIKSNVSSASVRSALSDIALERSVEFSYEELAGATNNFSEINKVGQGGYGSVYYGYLRDQKVAVKRMNLQATKEFLSELKILSRVHHSNLVQLIGYCTVDYLFLVYEFVDNGTLGQHLHGSGRPPLSWPSRVQIALDAARGLEYIHEHTKPTYIHRDIKPANILIDRNFHAKVSDFGITKLTETGIGSISLTQATRLVGTFGYMSPEYARFGDVTPSLDVYSFGVVLFEIISAQEAIIRTTSGLSSHMSQKDEQKGLVTLFEDALKDPNGNKRLRTLVDPRLGDNYPLEAAWSLAKLAGACTKENPDLRPNMRTVVVALMTLSASSQEASSAGNASTRHTHTSR